MPQLTIEIPTSQLSELADAGLKLALSRATADQNPAGVVWKAIDLAPKNQVSWSSSFGFYAALAKATLGSVLSPNSTLEDALANRVYTLDPQLVFTGPAAGSGAGAGVYAVDNDYTAAGPIPVGLIQQVVVNGQTSPALPIVAAPSLINFRSTYQPLDIAYLSLRSDATDGRVFDPASVPTRALDVQSAKAIVGPLTALDFKQATSLVAVYDPTTGGFNVSSSG